MYHYTKPNSKLLSHIFYKTSARSTVSALTSMATTLNDTPVIEFDNPFARAKLGTFLQIKPKLCNQYIEDVTLRNYLKRQVSRKIFTDVDQDLTRFGERVGKDVYELGIECEKNPPRLEQFDAWGKRQDRLITCEAWKQQKKVSAEEGLIAIAYERKYGEFSRLYQIAKLYLYSPSSGLYSCPLAMTDGAAKILEILNNPVLNEGAYKNLISRDPQKFWTSGQWMTERKGGSDVASGCETLAVPQDDGSYKLYGYKWFSSATDSDMTLTLARIVDDRGETNPGTKGISMFYMETRDENGELNGIEIQRLKDKLGTRQLPTAELLLDGAKAYRVSEKGRGVASISNMLTLTRIHNSTSSAAGMRRIINLARDYSMKRECFGKVIKDHALHVKTLANMEVEARSATLITLDMARLLGKDDCNVITEHEKNLLRILTPVAKLYTAKQAVAVASEGLECFGGAGYLEDTNLPVHLRDAQVLPIWEGTTNILSLDTLRALTKSKGAVLEAFVKEINHRLDTASIPSELESCVEKVKRSTNQIVQFATQNTDKLEIAGREFAYSVARTYMGMLLIDHASWTEANTMDIFAAKRWCERDLVPVVQAHKDGQYQRDETDLEFQLVFDGYENTSKL